MESGIRKTERSGIAYFVIDDSQHIVQWSHGAANFLGVPEDTALGLPCFEAILDRGGLANAICGEACPSFKALQNGDLNHTSRGKLTDGDRERLITCETVSLPPPSGSALVTLKSLSTERTPGEERPVDADNIEERLPLSEGSAADTMKDLANLGRLVTGFPADSISKTAEQTLEWLRQTLEVESSELFFLEPDGQDMLLSHVRGSSRSAFEQITRFHPGQGFPGLVFSEKAPISTTDLPNDDRYLRTRVTSDGFKSYVCVPVVGTDGILGSLNVASRSSDLDIARTQRLLAWVSVPLARALEAATTKTRLETLSDLDSMASQGGVEPMAQAILNRMIQMCGAVAGELLVLNPGMAGTLARVTHGDIGEPFCAEINHDDEPQCPTFEGEHGIAINGRRSDWAPRCREIRAIRGVIQCIPILSHSPVGITRLQYSRRGLSPPTRHLIELLAVAAQAARPLEKARDVAYAALREAQVSDAPPLEPSTRQKRMDVSQTTAQSEQPYLDVRCFGTFELQRDGQRIAPDAIRRRGALFLFKMLLVAGGRSIPRDVLSEALWPGADPDLTAKRVYVLIHALRRAIEPALKPHRRRWTYICSDGDRYYFNLESPQRCDILEFRSFIETGEQLEAVGKLEPAINSYAAALDLYSGDLLEDEPYAEWCWAERENLRETALSVAEKVGTQYSKWGVEEQSIAYYRRALRIDPLREQIHRGLIQSLLSAGRRAEALRQYAVCAQILQRELGIDPLPETQRLYAQASQSHTNGTSAS